MIVGASRAARTILALALICACAGCGTRAGSDASQPSAFVAAIPATVLLAGDADTPQAWAVTRRLLEFSDDGGISWRKVSGPFAPAEYLDVARADTNSAWAVGIVDGGVRLARTSDAGATWSVTAIAHPDGPSPAIGAAVQLLSSSVGFVTVQQHLTASSTEGWLYASTDGGDHFATARLPSITGSVTFQSPTVGTYVGLGGHIFGSDDGGQTWQPGKLQPGASSLSTPLPIKSSTYAVVATAQPGGGTSVQLAKQHGVGDYLPAGMPLAIKGEKSGGLLPAASDGKVVWVGVGLTLYASSDVGATWAVVATSGLKGGMLLLARPIAGRGFAVMQEGSCAAFKSDCTSTTTVYVSNDDGRTWVPAEL
jgi:photosystem II stability/assembly factor-like uncharacterized protein